MTSNSAPTSPAQIQPQDREEQQSDLRTAALPDSALRAASFWMLVGVLLLAADLSLQKTLALKNSGTLWLFRAGNYISLAFAILAILAAVGLAEKGNVSAPIRRIQADLARRLGIGEWQIPLLWGSVGCALLAAAAAGDGSRMFAPAIAPIAWGAGIGLAVAGGWVGPAGRGNARLALWALLFFLAALAIRLVRIDLPPFSGDEGLTGTDALNFVSGTADTFFRSVGFHPFPGFYYFLESISIRVLGRTVLAVRITSVLAGSLTVGALYLAARALFGHRCAAVAAALLAVSPFEIVFSHIGHSNIWDALSFTVFVGAVWYAWKNENRNAFLLAGLALGLGQYFYATSRWLIVLAAGGMAAGFLFDRSRFKRSAGGWAGLWLAAAAADLPLIFIAVVNPDAAGGHILSSSIFQPGWLAAAMQSGRTGLPGVLWNQIVRGFGAFTFFPSGAWYRPWTALLRPVEGALFLCGALLLAARPRDLRSGLLLGWIVSFGFIGALSESAPSAQRYVGSAPVLAIVCALALTEIGARLPALLPSARRWAAPAVAAVLLFVAADNLSFTFADYFPGSRFRGSHEFEGGSIAVANRTVELLLRFGTPREVVCLSGGTVASHNVPSELFLVPGYQSVFWNEPYGSPNNPRPDAARLLFIVPAGREAELVLVRRDYPGGESGAVYNWDGSLLFFYYAVTAENP